VLGLFQSDNWQFKLAFTPESGSLSISGSAPRLVNEEIEGKLVERNEARKQKDFKKADEIRRLLASHGIVIEDKPDGTSRWKR
jgi:cysteinyl-tRNA synthetase